MNILLIVSNIIMALATLVIALYTVINYIGQRRRDREIKDTLSSIQRTQMTEVEKLNLNIFQKYQDQQAEHFNCKKELDTLKHEISEKERIRREISKNDPLNIWLRQTIKGNPGYILSASTMDLEVLVKNTFAEEKSSAFIENAKKIGVVDDKLNLTTRGYNTLIKTAKYLSIDVQ